jgi:hypothetical protein
VYVQSTSLTVIEDENYEADLSERREMEQMVKCRMASLDLPLSEYGECTIIYQLVHHCIRCDFKSSPDVRSRNVMLRGVRGQGACIQHLPTVGFDGVI